MSYVDVAAHAKLHQPAPAHVFDGDTLRGHIGTRPIETLEPNEVLFWEGDAAANVFEIVSGVLRLYRLLSDGRRAIVGFMFPGDVLGVPCREGYSYTAEAVTTLRVRRLSRSQVFRLIDESVTVRRDLLAMAYDEMCAAQDHMLLLGRKTAEERVASFLLHVAKRASEEGEFATEISLPMTRLDMADYLGLTIETVSRLMSKLKNEDLIALPSPSKVILRDLDGLVEAASEDMATMTAQPSPIRAVHSAAWPH